jgi:hypothetical protein
MGSFPCKHDVKRRHKKPKPPPKIDCELFYPTPRVETDQEEAMDLEDTPKLKFSPSNFLNEEVKKKIKFTPFHQQIHLQKKKLL